MEDDHIRRCLAACATSGHFDHRGGEEQRALPGAPQAQVMLRAKVAEQQAEIRGEGAGATRENAAHGRLLSAAR
jgi:hypothetical protein